MTYVSCYYHAFQGAQQVRSKYPRKICFDCCPRVFSSTTRAFDEKAEHDQYVALILTIAMTKMLTLTISTFLLRQFYLTEIPLNPREVYSFGLDEPKQNHQKKTSFIVVFL